MCAQYKYLIRWTLIFWHSRKLNEKPCDTSLASHFVLLQASPARLLGRFAPSALRTRILGCFAPFKFKKKCVSIDSKWSKTHKNAKIFLPLWRASCIAQRAAKRNITYHCGCFAPSGFALCARILSHFAPSGYLPHDTPRYDSKVNRVFILYPSVPSGKLNTITCTSIVPVY